MEALVAQEKNSQEQMLESHEQQMTILGKKQIQLQQQMEENQKALMKCVTRIGTVIIVMLFICIMLLIPWGSSPIWPFLGLFILVSLGILGIIFRKRIIKWLR
jgi:Mg2+ and Co2+ transporter CorA